MIIKRTNVAFDLDGTLVDTHRIFYDEIDNATGVRIDPKKVTEFHLHNIYPALSREDVVKAVYRSYARWSEVKIKPGAVELMGELWNLTNDPVKIITARPWRYYENTHKLVSRIFGTIPFILIAVGMSGKKEQYINDKDIFVEDRRKTALEMAQSGKMVYLMDAPYNRENCEHDLIFRIKSLKQLKAKNLVTGV